MTGMAEAGLFWLAFSAGSAMGSSSWEGKPQAMPRQTPFRLVWIQYTSLVQFFRLISRPISSLDYCNNVVRMRNEKVNWVEDWIGTQTHKSRVGKLVYASLE